MKRSFISALVLSLVSIPAFAASKPQTVNLANPVTVGSTKLPAGEYKITWTGDSPNVQVTLVQKAGRNPVSVTAPAKLVDQKNDQPGVTTSTQNGTSTLEQLQLKNYNVVFTSAPSSGQ